MDEALYKSIRNGSSGGYFRSDRLIVNVSGGEAIQFLNGMVTNDVEALRDGEAVKAAFPNPKGRLLGVAGILRKGDSFLIETEPESGPQILENLVRFSYAGDFSVEDKSGEYVAYRFFGRGGGNFEEITILDHVFVNRESTADFEKLLGSRGLQPISEDLYEVLRIEEGIPRFGKDMTEETVVPETGIAGMISYEKGCYVGQEVIARIHFRGKVAKALTGLIFDEVTSLAAEEVEGVELKSMDGKNAGFITSAVNSPELGRLIALGYVRSAYNNPGERLVAGENRVSVRELPFVGKFEEKRK